MDEKVEKVKKWLRETAADVSRMDVSGDSEIFPAFADYLLSEEGREDLNDLVQWLDEDDPNDIYRRGFEHGFVPKNWLSPESQRVFRESLTEDEIPWWWVERYGEEGWKNTHELWDEGEGD